MDIFKDNFLDYKESIEEEIRGCDFIAVDFEMTGINLPGPFKMDGYDDIPADRYGKMVNVVDRYSIIQMGICIFTKDGKRGKKNSGKGGSHLTARPYNFYTFAEEGDDVVLSLSAIHFLKDHGMNFNDWLQKGVSYTNVQGEENYLKKMEQERQRDEENEKGGDNGQQRVTLSKPNDKTFVAEQMELLKTWYEGGRTPKELCLNRCNAWLRRALFQHIKDLYPDLSAETRNGQIVVMKLTEDEKKARFDEREAERKRKFNNKVGLRHVFKTICETGCPLIVHNGMYDLLFMMKAFHGPLARTLEGFKKQLQNCLPTVYDTKYISTREDLLQMGFTDGGVKGLYTALVTEPGWNKVVLASGFEKYDESQSAGFEHEAGYDAYLTGANFARMQELLAPSSHQHVVNRIYNFRSLYETNLSGEDALLFAESHVFHLGLNLAQGQKINTEDLKKVFGEHSTHTDIYWIDDLGAFAVVNNSEVTQEQVLNKVVKVEGVHVSRYDVWLQQKKAHGRDVSALTRLMKRALSFMQWGTNKEDEVPVIAKRAKVDP